MTKNPTYRILLIDDQETIHEDYRKVLGVQPPAATALGKAAAELFDDDAVPPIDWEGFELDSAFQGQQGFELVQKSIVEGRPYALAFVDIRMPPGWDGIQTVRRIWEIDPEILVVICSAYSDYSWEEMVRQLGRNDRFLILKKPFDNVEVRQCAMALTERWSVSRTDVLTGLLNRRAFHGHLELEWARAGRHRYPLSCAMVDLDFFKRINDTHGHRAGDQVLRAIAQRLQANCRVSDYVCRYGGEELCVLLPHSDESGAAQWAEHTRAAICAAPIMVGGRAVNITASIGVSERRDAADAVEHLIDRADEALLVAKKMGRNCVARFSHLDDSNHPAPDELRYRKELFDEVTARQVMTAASDLLDADSTVGDAAEMLLQSGINSVPVVNDEGKLIGIVSEKDVIAILLCRDASQTPVEQIMQRNMVTYDPDTAVQTICDFLSRSAIQRVVIVEAGRPVGIVSRGSLLRWYRDRSQSRTLPGRISVAGEAQALPFPSTTVPLVVR